jgi:hypothetical protein
VDHDEVRQDTPAQGRDQPKEREATAEHNIRPGLYAEAGFLAENTDRGLRLYSPAPIDNAPSVTALRVGKAQHSNELRLQTLGSSKQRPLDPPSAMEYRIGDTLASGGIFDAVTKEKLERQQSVPLDDQLREAGF